MLELNKQILFISKVANHNLFSTIPTWLLVTKNLLITQYRIYFLWKGKRKKKTLYAPIFNAKYYIQFNSIFNAKFIKVILNSLYVTSTVKTKLISFIVNNNP